MAITAQKFIPQYKKENPKISFKSYTTLNSLDDESLKPKKSSNIISSESVETLGEIRVGLVSIAEVIKKDFGDIDVLINNASAFEFDSIKKTSHEIFDNHIDVNLKAPFFLSKCYVENYKKSD